MSEVADGRLSKRLRRILVLLPYAVRHPGVGIDELARKFDVKKRDLIDDLNLVFLCGLPGYGPGDLIEATIDEDRVYVRMADYFGSPLRLTPAEALALYAGGRALAALPGMEEAESLKRGLAKLRRALGAHENDGEGTGIAVELDTAPATHLEALQRSLTERTRVELDYRSASRGELTTRSVDPWGLIASGGRWYLVGFDHLSNDERMFRADRIKDVRISQEDAEVPDDFDPERYRGAFVDRPDERLVTFEISPAAAKWFEDYYPVREAKDLADGWREVTLASSSDRWPALLALRLGSDVRNIRPDSVLETARELAAALATRHACT
ncbi:MAG: WYL domain-containing protein [Actinomycetota bacterium]|nr:WYL domain-containing protein [Actinomycetota bacterium]